MRLAILRTLFSFACLAVLLLAAREYILLRRKAYGLLLKLSMDCEELVERLLSDPVDDVPKAPPPTPDGLAPQKTESQRARLAAVAAGGMSVEYIGKRLSESDNERLDDAEVTKLYDRYQSRLGGMMVKTLGGSVLQLYALAADRVLPIPQENQPKLIEDLSADPFVSSALTNLCCEAYHKWGMYLAPLTVALTTAKHCDFRQTEPIEKHTHVVVHDGNLAGADTVLQGDANPVRRGAESD